MTQSPNQFLETCLEATNSGSYRNLARKIGVGSQYLYDVKSGKALPSADVMIDLAARANLDQREALILLNIWRESGKARALYVDMLKKFTAIIWLTCLFFTPNSGMTDKSLILNDNLSVSRASLHVQKPRETYHFNDYDIL